MRRLLFGLFSAIIALPVVTLIDRHDEHAMPLTTDRRAARDRMIERLKTQHGPSFDRPDEALEFYWAKRSPTGEPMGITALEEAADAVADMPVLDPSESGGDPHTTSTAPTSPLASGTSATGAINDWQALGPGNVGGRSRALLIHDKRDFMMWTAGVAGGIWKSVDGGASWQPKGDLLVNIAVNSMIQDPKLENVLYAGTGEGFFNVDAVRGQGIFKSTDFGETWVQLPKTDTQDFWFVQKLAATRHKKRQRIYAATRTGILRSTDFGATWTKVLDASAVNGCTDLAIQHHTDEEDAPRYVFAACGQFAQGTVWRAIDVDAGQKWERVLEEVDMSRTSLALSRSNPSVIYALASFWHIPFEEPQDHGLLAVYRSTENGAAGTWETRVHYTDTNKLNTMQLTNPVLAFLADCGFDTRNEFLHQGWYNNQIAVDPKNPEIVWTAGIDLMRSDDGGRTWGIANYWWFDAADPNYAHADNHAITFHPKYNGSSNRQMFVASDGGVYRTDDARAPVGTTLESVCGQPVENQVAWTSLNNGYQVTQFYHGAVYPDGATFFGGTQDNGTLLGTIAGGQKWREISGGDGGYVAVDRNDTNVIYVSNTGKSLQRSLDGGETFTFIHGGVVENPDNFQFIHPFAMDPTHPDRLWYGGVAAWRSNNRGTNWTRVSSVFGARISAWAVAPSDPNRVYVGMQNLGAASGRIFRTSTATTLTTPVTWASAHPRRGYVSSIAVDPTTATTAYATYSTFNLGTSVGHVFKTVNGGVSWTRIDETLPDMPVHSVAVHPTHPDTIFIGTDLGVFVTIDGGATWLRENIGFANVIVEHLEINNERLFVFTHGRSVWSVPLAE